MTWYDKNAVAQWKVLVDKPYSFQSLLQHKDMILKEILKTQEIQQYIKTNRNSIVQNCLQMCLQYPSIQSSYDRKYVYPTKAIEILTHELFFIYLGWEPSSIKHYIHHLFKYFSTVNPHIDNVNLYHGYFQRLWRLVLQAKYIDKWTLVASFEEEEVTHGVINHLFNHSHKYSIIICLQTIFSLDFIEPLICLNLDIKKKIINFIFQQLQSYTSKKCLQNQQQSDKIEHMLILLRFYLQRSIKFCLEYTVNEQINKQYKNGLNQQKLEHYLYMYNMFQSNFSIFWDILTQSRSFAFKIIIFQILQINQILYFRARRKQIAFQVLNPYYQKIISHMFSTNMTIYHPAFIDWLLIFFSQVGESQFKTELVLNIKILEKIMKIIINHKLNSILLAKLFELLKIIFINLQKQIFLTIQRYKNNPNHPMKFTLFNQYMTIIPILKQIVKEFKSINEVLFTFMFKLFKIIAQYAVNIEQIFNHYGQLDICKDSLVKIREVIQFQKEEPCFSVYQREIGKELGNFYAQQVFVNQKPLQWTIKELNKSIIPVVSSSVTNFVPQTQQQFIKLPENNSSMMKSQQIILQILQKKPQEQKIQFQPELLQAQNIEKRVINSETLIRQSQEILQDKILSNENIVLAESVNNEQDQKLKFNKFMKTKINEISTDINARRSQSRTPNKIKNQLKKAKNKWIQSSKDQSNEENIKIPFSTEVISERKVKSYSSPKLPKHLEESNFQKIELIRLSKNRKPKVEKQRILCQNRDSRLVNWLRVLRA